MDPAIELGALVVGGIANVIGSYISGEYSLKQLDRELEYKREELNASIALESRRLGISENRLRQEWDMFIKTIKQRKYEFAQEFGLETEKFEFEKEAFEKTYGLGKEALAHQKYMDVINPIMEQKKRAKNIITAFSGMTKKPAAAAPAATPAPVNPLTAPQTGYQNPLT